MNKKNIINTISLIYFIVILLLSKSAANALGEIDNLGLNKIIIRYYMLYIILILLLLYFFHLDQLFGHFFIDTLISLIVLEMKIDIPIIYWGVLFAMGGILVDFQNRRSK